METQEFRANQAPHWLCLLMLQRPPLGLLTRTPEIENDLSLMLSLASEVVEGFEFRNKIEPYCNNPHFLVQRNKILTINHTEEATALSDVIAVKIHEARIELAKETGLEIWEPLLDVSNRWLSEHTDFVE